ncbi:MAG: OmpA family protein, partial [Pseudomonadota bacterium]
LAERVGDLERFRSVFFERMDEVLGERDDIRREGDRFVFQSEVLFEPGSATLGPEGRRELAELGTVLRRVGEEVPADFDWVLRVDGHTDRVPMNAGSGAKYTDNWELSQGRALSVVRYLIEAEGVAPERLAATGFGEHRPVDPGSDREALARNRRIEFKFTQR